MLFFLTNGLLMKQQAAPLSTNEIADVQSLTKHSCFSNDDTAGLLGPEIVRLDRT